MDSKYKRYYLHRRIKTFGAVVHPKQRMVELDDKLFRYPSALLSTYLYKLKNFNYFIQSTIMLPETSTKQENNQVVKFLEKEDLIEKFKYVNSRMNILDKASLELKVESDEQLTIAENNAKEVIALSKEVDSVRKIMKAPYADTVKMIDSYCKIIDDTFARIKIRFTSQVTDFKIIKEAQLKAEKDAKLKEVEAMAFEKKEEAEKIKRIEAQLVARIYGGVYIKKDGSSQALTGCIKSADCDDLLKWINENIPEVTSFKHFSGLYEDMMRSVKKKLSEHRANLYNLEVTTAPKFKEMAMQNINNARVDAAQDIQKNEAAANKVIDKAVKTEIRILDAEIKDAGKGVRQRIIYEVKDELLVPRDFLGIDSEKVNDYINANKDKIKTSIAGNEEIIPGIRFLIDNSFVAR